MVNQALKDLFDQAFTLAPGCGLLFTLQRDCSIPFSGCLGRLPKNPKLGCTVFVEHRSKNEGGEYYTWTGLMWAPLTMLKRRDGVNENVLNNFLHGI